MPSPTDKRERKIAMPVPPTLLVLGCLTAACSRQSPEAPSTPATRMATAAAAVSASPPPAHGKPREVKQSDDLVDFQYSYPAAADAIPDLKAMLDADLEKQKADLIADAKQQRAERNEADFPYHPLGSWTAWKVVTDLPRWLSLSAEVSTYEGGAHPNHAFDALLWDRQENRRRAPLDLFTSKAALSRAIRKDFCAALDRQRAEKRGEPVKPGSTEEFDRCIDPVESTVILGSSNHKTFDRIGVLVAPYSAGPYAEGDYEVTLPVTKAVLAAVKPEYQASFAVKQ
jgi:hypothetical protein